MKIRALQKTFLKKNTLDSTKLNVTDLVEVEQGKEYKIIKSSIAEKNHLKVELDYKAGTWFIYKPDWDLLNTPKLLDIVVNFIKKYEGFSSKAYPDSLLGSQLLTIGYGTTVYPNGDSVEEEDVCTEEQATNYLKNYIDKSLTPNLSKILHWDKLNIYQKSAIYSFAYNLGSYFYNTSNFKSMSDLLNNPQTWNDAEYVKSVFVKYRNPGTNVEEGLKKRRLEEADLFLKQDELPIKTNRSSNIKKDDNKVTQQVQLLKKYCPANKVLNLNTKVNYFPQRDNYTQQHRTCNSSSNAMYADWVLRATGNSGLSGDDGYLSQVIKRGDSTIHEVQTRVLKEVYKISSTWKTDGDLQLVKDLLFAGIPVVVNILHRGTLNALRGGHVIVLISYKSEVFICQDPYGTLSSDYKDTNGAYSKVSENEFKIRWQKGYRILIEK